jgi:hypothetical protein
VQAGLLRFNNFGVTRPGPPGVNIASKRNATRARPHHLPVRDPLGPQRRVFAEINPGGVRGDRLGV